MPILEIGGLSKMFGGVHAIDDLSFEVDEGEIVSIIGPNGAGKTSLFNMITGMIRPDDGAVLLEVESRRGDREHVDIVGLPPSDILELGIARTFQNVRLFQQMTIRENVMVARHARTKSNVVGAILKTPRFRREEEETKRRAEQALAFFGSRLVGYRLDQLAISLSYANRRRLEMARAMASDPKILLLDEPTAGMNPRETLELTELIGRMRSDLGLTVVLIEHDMKVVKGVSDRVIVLDYGRKIAEGQYERIATDERVIEAYLGTKATT